MSNMSLDISQVARRVAAVSAACAFVLCAQVAGATDRDQAKRMHDRIAGVPPTQSVLNSMETLVQSGDYVGAALIATDNPAFYNVTLKNFVTPWTNRDQSVFAPLNDYTATVIGMVRDNKPFNTVLSADILYRVNAGGIAPLSAANNDHYSQAEANGIDLKAALEETAQSSAYGIPPAGTAGVITSRAASEAFFIDGTNRAMFRFTMINHMCRDLEQLSDTTLPPDLIRQDVSRSPGGDSRIFLNNCIGCHTGMDPMTQAFAYYDFDETQQRLVYTPGTVNPKYFLNADNFKPGFVTPDDSWVNRWRSGQNSVLQFSNALPGSGAGAKSLGEEIANSQAFAQCQVEKVFKAVCFRNPNDSGDDQTAVAGITGAFKAGYNLRRVFAETAAYCRGN